VLVRVQTKLGVQWLAHRLRSQGVKAAAVIGRGDMSEVKSKKALHEFKHTQDVNVLVATSMLEEGIDLKNCDLVVAYGVFGVLNSGKSVTQNAGRARKEDAEFLVFARTEAEKLRFLRMVEQERVTNEVSMGEVNQ
jgi:interferon-induced helicase C domain-containing protein 1